MCSKVKKVTKSLQSRLNKLTSSIIERAPLQKEERDKLNSVKMYPVDQACGRAYFEDSTITIPKWAFDSPRKGFLEHYVAHELAHILAYSRYKATDHGKEFYECLCLLAREETLTYEVEYKPKRAAKFLTKYIT